MENNLGRGKFFIAPFGCDPTPTTNGIWPWWIKSWTRLCLYNLQIAYSIRIKGIIFERKKSKRVWLYNFIGTHNRIIRITLTDKGQDRLLQLTIHYKLITSLLKRAGKPNLKFYFLIQALQQRPRNSFNEIETLWTLRPF